MNSVTVKLKDKDRHLIIQFNSDLFDFSPTDMDLKELAQCNRDCHYALFERGKQWKLFVRKRGTFVFDSSGERA